MVNKKIFSLTFTLALLLSSCGTVQSSGPRITVPPEESSSSEPSILPSDSSENSSSSSSSIPDHIEITDHNNYYFVGETFVKAFRATTKLFYQGAERDISSRSTGFDFILKDSSGKTVDHNKPFEKAGKYTYQMYITNRESIISNTVQIEVKNSPTNKLTSKTKMPEGFTYYDFENSCGSNLSIPSTGNINCLVIPVEVSDYPFTSIGYGENYMSSLNKLFNGDGVKDTQYWESISSFYYKSSQGKLKLNFEIADVYQCGFDSTAFLNTGMSAAFAMAEITVNHYKEVHGNGSTVKFDNDHDGYIDGLWMVYSAPDYSTGAYGSTSADVFWAFCSDLGSLKADISSPNPWSFGWASADFMYEGCEPPKVDAHTFIHETGHLLSLPDYYSYSLNGVKASGAQGGLAMMDLNIGDQDSFSKLALGWSEPYVVDKDCIVTIKPNVSSNECIVLADNFNGTAFDEYIIIDLVSPTGLNELDSKEQYTWWRPYYYSEPGVRMYHIDARLGKFVYLKVGEAGASYEGVQPLKDDKVQKDYYLTDDMVKDLVVKGHVDKVSSDTSVHYKGRTPGYTVINANSTSRSKIDTIPYNNNRLISLIGADNKVCEKDDSQGTNASLFKKGDCWTVNGLTLRNFSSEENVFNNGDDFSFVISILDCSSSSATVQIRKVSK